jgi:3-oxoacid CoA-transferase subunit B
MDLVHGAQKIIVIMEHVNKKGESKILKQCTLPLTGKGVFNRIITERAVMDVTESGLRLVEVAKRYTVEDVVNSTEATLSVDDENVVLDAY